MTENRLLWGDLHNHNQLGYAQGTLERSYEIARSHLDFYAFTPHGMVAEKAPPPGSTKLKVGDADPGSHVIYPVVETNWHRVQQAAADNYAPGEFTCFLGYEWHSSTWGDVHVVHTEPDRPIHYEPTLEQLQDHYRGQQAILVHHHIAYDHGIDWDLFDPEVSPVVEIYSEHGCSERDIGLHPMLGHQGPGDSRFTALHGLSLGKRFGFTAGTDNHDGHPGGYGLGLTGVWARDNTREAVLEALLSRRTVAVTGDRIDMDFRAGDEPMGSAVSHPREISFQVRGWDYVKQVELVRNGVPVLVRSTDYAAPPADDEDVYRVRLEWGWGPMKGFQLFDWQGKLRLVDGELLQYVPCFSSDPFDEQRRKRVVPEGPDSLRWQSHTSRGGVLNSRNGPPSHRANDALCLEVRGTRDTRLELDIHCETHTSILATTPDWPMSPRLGRLRGTVNLGELIDGRRALKLEEMPTLVVAHRAIPRGQFTVEGSLDRGLDEPAWYYLRVTQENGQMGWASPIWIEA